MLKIGKSFAALITVGLFAAGVANADTLSFTESTTASGSLGGTAFTNELVTFSGTGNTNNITLLSPGIYAIIGLPVSVDVAGVGTANFTDTIQLVSNQPNTDVGIGDNTANFAVLFGSVANSGYDLSTSFGPVSGAAILNPGTAFGTDEGSFDLTTAGTVTYQATVSLVPEPASWALMLMGFASVGFAIRSRRIKAATAS